MQTHRRTLLAQTAILAIQIYRNTLSKLVLPSCRFMPSCSAYAINAIQRYGALRGGWRALGRLLRCHPFTRGGIDPVEPHPVLRGGSCSHGPCARPGTPERAGGATSRTHGQTEASCAG